MSNAETTGVAALGRILSRLAEGKPTSATELARIEGLARSTTFDVVRRLKAAGFVEREAGSKLIAGPASIALGFARFGLAALHGPAEALLIWLRDQTAATATLTTRKEGTDVVLLSIATDRLRRSPADRELSMTRPLIGRSGNEVARLRLNVHRNASAAERKHAERALSRVKLSLEQHLATQ